MDGRHGGYRTTSLLECLLVENDLLWSIPRIWLQMEYSHPVQSLTLWNAQICYEKLQETHSKHHLGKKDKLGVLVNVVSLSFSNSVTDCMGSYLAA